MTQTARPLRPLPAPKVSLNDPRARGSRTPAWTFVTTFSAQRRHLPNRRNRIYTLCHAAACQVGDLVRTGHVTQEEIDALMPCPTCIKALAQGGSPCEHTDAYAGRVEAHNPERGIRSSVDTCLRCVEISRAYVAAVAGAPASGFIAFQRFIA